MKNQGKRFIMKKLIIIGVLSILSLFLFIDFCYRQWAVAAFIAAVPTTILNGYVIYLACYGDFDED